MAQDTAEKKCILAVVPEARVQRVEARLRHQDRRYTRLTAQGGFMRRGNTVLMLVTIPEAVDTVIAAIRAVPSHGSIGPASTMCATRPPTTGTRKALGSGAYRNSWRAITSW